MIRFLAGFVLGAVLAWWWLSRPMALIPPRDPGHFDDMCPNCVTPWKCNGPHEPPSDPYVLDQVAELLRREGL